MSTTPSVGVVVDSSAGIGPELARAWGIMVVPSIVQWRERTFRDGVDLVSPGLYASLARGEAAHTASPTPG